MVGRTQLHFCRHNIQFALIFKLPKKAWQFGVPNDHKTIYSPVSFSWLWQEYFFPICTNFSACSCILLSVYIFPPLKSFYQFHGKIATPRLSSSGLNASCIAHCCFSYPITGFSWPCFMILSHFFTNILFICCGLINGNCYRTFTWTFALLKGTWFVRTRFKKSHSQVAVPFHQFGSKMGFI